MKTFKNILVVKEPMELVWETVRDRLPELAPLVDDIESVTVVERDDSEIGRVRLLNEWRSRQSIPGFMQAKLGSPNVGWLDRNEWDDATRICTWRIEPNVLRGQITCEGTTFYEPAIGGRGSRVTIQGTFSLAPGALPLATFVESIVTTLVPKNFRKVLEAAAQWIETSRKA